MASIRDIERLNTSEELQDAGRKHNWDDGFEIPTAIANHPKCDLAVALSLFWLSEAIVWLTGEVKQNEHNQAWVSFCGLITNRILHGYYKVGSGTFVCPLSKVQIYRHQKKGVPLVLVSSVNSENA